MQSKRPIAAETASLQAILPHRKLSRPVPLPSRWNWARGGNTSFEGVCVAKVSTPPANPHPNPPTKEVKKAPEQPKLPATRETSRPQKTEPKSTVAPNKAAGKSKKKPAASAKHATDKTTPPNLVVLTQTSTSSLEDISDLLEHRPHSECVELTRRILASISSIPPGAARMRAVLKTVIHFSTEYGNTP